MKAKKQTKGELTVTQESAVDLLASGKNDTETAEALGIHRVTVTRWRNYLPEFRAALADRRRMIWGSAADQLRSLLPKALKVLQGNLDSEDVGISTQAAYGIIRIAGKLPLEPVEPTEPYEYVRQIAHQERKQISEHKFDNLNEYPDFDAHCETIRKRLRKLSAEAE